MANAYHTPETRQPTVVSVMGHLFLSQVVSQSQTAAWG